MDEFSPDYTHDLDWMLQTDQVPKEVLLEALLDEYYRSIIQLSFYLLDNLSEAQSVTKEVFSTALINTFTYREKIGVQIWLTRLALKIINRAHKRLQSRRVLLATLPIKRKGSEFGDSIPKTEQDAVMWLTIDSLDEWTRLLLILYYTEDWNIKDIALLLESEQDSVTHRIDFGVTQLFETLVQEGVYKSDTSRSQFEKILKESLNKRWELSDTNNDSIQELYTAILRQALQKGTRLNWISYSKEIAVILLTILLAVGVIWISDQIWSDSKINTTPTPIPTQKINEVVYDAHSPSEDITITQFAFTSENQRLAVFGYHGYTIEREIFVIDVVDDDQSNILKQCCPPNDRPK